MPSANSLASKFHTSLFAALLAVLALNLIAPGAAQAQSLPLYSISSGDDYFEIIDPLTGETLRGASIILAGKTVNWSNGLAKNPQTGELFAVLTLAGQTGRELVKLNPTTAVATDVGNTGDNFAGITFAANGTLYAVTGDGAATPETLYTLDTSTGAKTLVVALGNGDSGETIAFNPVDGLIYHASGQTTQVFETINPTTLAVTDIPQSGDAHDEATGLAHWTGNFFLLTDVSGGLYLVTKDGQARFLSSTAVYGYSYIKGMVFGGSAPACPPFAALYGAANQGPDGPSLFYSLDPATGAPTLIGPIGFERVSGIGFNGTTLFGTGERQDGSNTSVLVMINPCTGAGTEVGPTGIEGLGFPTITDISVDQSDGTLFAHAVNPPATELARIDTSTGQATLVGQILSSGNPGNGIAFSQNGTLFHADQVNLNTIDTATGAPTLVAALGFSPPADNGPRVNALDFQPATGVLFASVNDGQSGAAENYLGTIDTTTGVVTLVSSTQTQSGLDAIAFSPAVQVPTADLSLSKSGAPDPIIEGDNLTYTLKVTNNGPSGATVVTLSDPLPAGVTYVSATPGQGSCSQAGGTVTCGLGSVASGAQVTVTIVVRPTGAASLSNTASVTGTESDPDLTNNSATATGTALGFTFSNTSGTVTVKAGATGQFTIHVVPGAGGFPNSITFDASNLPIHTIASFNPTSVTPGTTPADVVLSLATTAPALLPPSGIPMRGPWPLAAPLLTACTLMLLWLVMRRQQRQYQRLAAPLPLMVLLICAATFLGCNGQPSPSGGTPAGTYTVNVTATSGTASHTSTVTLVVQ